MATEMDKGPVEVPTVTIVHKEIIYSLSWETCVEYLVTLFQRRKHRQKRRQRSSPLFGGRNECRTSHLAARKNKVLEEHPVWECGNVVWCEPDEHLLF